MEIIAMGIFTVACIIFFGIRHLAHTVTIVELENKLQDQFDSEVRYDNSRAHTIRRMQDKVREAKFQAEMMLAKNKKLEQDIDCFRAELGLGPRLYDDSAELNLGMNIPSWQRPPITIGTEMIVKFTTERGCDD